MKDYKEFTLTEDHITLLRQINVDVVPGCGPQIDQKRPFRDSDVERDIAEMLGWELFEDADEETHLSKAQYDTAKRLHAETAIALEVVLRTTSFTPGLYRTSSSYGDDWTLAPANDSTPAGDGSPTRVWYRP